MGAETHFDWFYSNVYFVSFIFFRQQEMRKRWTLTCGGAASTSWWWSCARWCWRWYQYCCWCCWSSGRRPGQSQQRWWAPGHFPGRRTSCWTNERVAKTSDSPVLTICGAALRGFLCALCKWLDRETVKMFTDVKEMSRFRVLLCVQGPVWFCGRRL